jgi:hypothetical protein
MRLGDGASDLMNDGNPHPGILDPPRPSLSSRILDTDNTPTRGLPFYLRVNPLLLHPTFQLYKYKAQRITYWALPHYMYQAQRITYWALRHRAATSPPPPLPLSR